MSGISCWCDDEDSVFHLLSWYIRPGECDDGGTRDHGSIFGFWI